MKGNLLFARAFVRLAVEVVRVESENGSEGFSVTRTLKVLVRSLTVPWVEGVVSDHVESGFGKGRLVLHDEVL